MYWEKKETSVLNTKSSTIGWKILTFMSDFISLYICYANRIENTKEYWYENATYLDTVASFFELVNYI